MIGVIGCGNMGEALIKGLKSRFKAATLLVYDKDRRKLSRIKKIYAIKKIKSLSHLISLSKTIIIAVKPQDISNVLEAIKQGYSGQLIISIAAGIPTSFIESRIAGRAAVVRAMPNLGAKVLMGLSGICKGRFATKSDLNKALKIFNSVGVSVVLSEKYIDALTAVSGSMPGYVYYFLYCLVSSAVKLGFSKDKANFLVLNTIKGSIELISKEDDFLDLVDKVASRGGTTQAALDYFKQRKLKDLVDGAVKKAYMRAKNLQVRS